MMRIRNLLVHSAFILLSSATLGCGAIADCGQSYVAPALRPVIGGIDDVVQRSWPWTVNICLFDVTGDIDCGSLSGLIVGNASNLVTRWILTTISGEYEARNLLVIIGADYDRDLIKPSKVGAYPVKRLAPLIRFPDQNLRDTAVPTLLELYDNIIMSEVTQIVPICLSAHVRGELPKYNNTAAWVVGWAGAAGAEISLRQFYTVLSYYPREMKQDLFALTSTPANGEQFRTGSVMLRSNATNWFAHALTLFCEAGDDEEKIMVFERVDLSCKWITKITDAEVNCIPLY